MPELIVPDVSARAAWLDAHAEWGPGLHEDGFGLGPDDDVETAGGFAVWLARIGTQSDPARTTDVGRHRCTYRWIVEGERVVGGIALRNGDDEYIRWAGHVGYGIRPSARGHGLATWALGRMLGLARVQGMVRVLAVCAVDNAASVRTLERNGGVFEGVLQTPFGPARRYWFELASLTRA